MYDEMEKKHMDNQFWYRSILGKIVMVLLLAGALNWLSIGVWHINAVENLVGDLYADYVYILVGVAAIVVIVHKIMVLSHSRMSMNSGDSTTYPPTTYPPTTYPPTTSSSSTTYPPTTSSSSTTYPPTTSSSSTTTYPPTTSGNSK